jgi:hypothetical protein
MELLKTYLFKNKKRMGENGDGGYIYAELPVYDCYISAGIGNDDSCSKDFINKYNLNKEDCFAFDGTIDNYPSNGSDKINFIKKNIDGFCDDKHTDLSFLTDKYNDIFLKMDVEGGEFKWLSSISFERLSKFKQMSIEFHGMNDNDYGSDIFTKLKCFEKLTHTHYLIHAHGNNCAGTRGGFPDVIELTYVNKKCFSVPPQLNTIPLPIPNLDYPNNSGIPDINLNFFPFTSLNN